jgi:hypothetical protein
VDPLVRDFPWYTPYQFAGNKPVYAIDLDGAEELPYWQRSEIRGSDPVLSKGWKFSVNSLKAIYNDVGSTWNYGVNVTRTGIHEGPLSAAQKIKTDVEGIALGAYDYATTTSYEQFSRDLKDVLSSVETYEQGMGAVLTAGAGAALKAGKLGKLSNLSKPSRTPNTTDLVPYDPQFAVKQGLNVRDGTFDFDALRPMIPKDVPNTFNASPSIMSGEKYKFFINDVKVELKWHTPDSDAGMRFPGSNSGTTNTVQIKVGNKYLNQSGDFQRRPDNSTHIPKNEQ